LVPAVRVRVLWLGDLAPTGFGSVTRDLGSEMLKLGADIRFVSQNDTGDDLPEPFRSRTVSLISLNVAQGKDGIGAVTGADAGIGALFDGSSPALMHSGEPYAGWIPEAIIILADFAATRYFVGAHYEAFRAFGGPILHYIPIEGDDLPPEWARLWELVSPVAMSNFGADEIAKVTGTRPPVVYHGVDTKTFFKVTQYRPLTLKQGSQSAIIGDRKSAKWQLVAWLSDNNRETLPTDAKGRTVIPKYWMLRTDSHWPRKQQNALIRTLGPLLARHTDWGLVLHTGVMGPGGYLWDTLSKLPPDQRERIMLTRPGIDDAYVDRQVLAALYNASDLYVSNSAEGFGLTIAEALACGTPAVGANYSAVPEVIGPAGVTVDVAHLFDNGYDHNWCSVDPDDLARKVEFLMTHHGRREDLGRKGPAHVAANFRWGTAAAQFVDLIHASVPQGVAA
jgi:glycosyltransferase involved in cell wall biosynthesis